MASEEGVELREMHQRNAKMLRNKIIQAGIPVIYSPSHIIPVHVSKYSHIILVHVSKYSHIIPVHVSKYSHIIPVHVSKYTNTAILFQYM